MFDRADTTKSGSLSLAELKAALCRVDPLLEESAVIDMMTMLDLEAVGSVSFEEVGFFRVRHGKNSAYYKPRVKSSTG